MSEQQSNHEVTVKKFEIQNKFKISSLPTDDQEVRRLLRENLQPMTVFGEGPSQRRDRLYEFLVNQKVDKELEAKTKKDEAKTTTEKMEEEFEGESDEESEESEGESGGQKKKNELFFTKSDDALLAASRKFFAEYSIPRALERNQRQKKLFSSVYTTQQSIEQKKLILHKKFEKIEENENEPIVKDHENRTKLFSSLKNVELLLSHHISRRPVSSISTLKLQGDNMLEWIALTLSWTGDLSFYRTLTGTQLSTIKAHEERGSCLACAKEQSIISPNIHCVTGGADNLVKLWTIPKKNLFGERTNQPGDSSSITTSSSEKKPKPRSVGSYAFSGHKKRISKVAFHPSEKFFVSTSFDKTWCLYDVSRRKQILQQTGHSKPVYGVDFQCDGSLISTTDLGGIVRIWDLRTGRSLMTFSGHSQQVNAVAFSPNGFQIASGGDDDTVKLWDLRQKKSFSTILAHKKLVSFLKFEPNYGRFFVTGSYDKSIRFWSSNEGHLIHSLEDAHDGVIFDGEITSWEKGTIPSLSSQASAMETDNAANMSTKNNENEGSVMIVDDYSTIVDEDEKSLVERPQPGQFSIPQESFSVVSCSYDKTFKVFHSNKQTQA